MTPGEEALSARIDSVDQRIGRVEDNQGKIFDKLDKYLPPWVMGAAWTSGAIIGALGMLVKMH